MMFAALVTVGRTKSSSAPVGKPRMNGSATNGTGAPRPGVRPELVIDGATLGAPLPTPRARAYRQLSRR